MDNFLPAESSPNFRNLLARCAKGTCRNTALMRDLWIHAVSEVSALLWVGGADDHLLMRSGARDRSSRGLLLSMEKGKVDQKGVACFG